MLGRKKSKDMDIGEIVANLCMAQAFGDIDKVARLSKLINDAGYNVSIKDDGAIIVSMKEAVS